MNLIYDIRTQKAALNTLCRFTDIKIKDCNRMNKPSVDEICNYISPTINFDEVEYIYTHITTSSCGCESIKKHGILDLRKAYDCSESELRIFLEENGIYINIETQKLTYGNRDFDIKYTEEPPLYDPKKCSCWSIGRKFYYDYATCGFLSIDPNDIYEGNVHQRPEILMDIDNLLGTNLSMKWQHHHSPYMIVAKVKGIDILHHAQRNMDEQAVKEFIMDAYNNAFHSLDNLILITKNNVHIPPSDILEIKPFTTWN